MREETVSERLRRANGLASDGQEIPLTWQERRALRKAEKAGRYVS